MTTFIGNCTCTCVYVVILARGALNLKRRQLARFFKPYSIYVMRRTTVAHAFASALAPTDTYDDERAKVALRLLGQDPDAILTCVYCDKNAETWDHIHPLVRASEYAGFGHALGNLVPCCGSCNSKKGGTDWIAFLAKSIPDQQRRKAKLLMLTSYIEQYGRACFTQLDIGALCEEEMTKYRQIHASILVSMKEADDLAAAMRSKVRERLEHPATPDAAAPELL